MTQTTTTSRKAKPSKKTSKASAKTKKKSSKPKLTVQTAPVEETPVVEVVKEELPKMEATRESITAWFDRAISDVEDQVKLLRKNKCQGGKFLKSLNKTLKNLKTKSLRVMGKKPKKRTNVNSGFLKQVAISKEMAKFIGCDPTELKSRVDVTKHICNYVKEHGLQNPNDKREIIPDAKLKKLLRVQKGDPALTYYRVQSKLKPHFSN
jgi:chromatin remodeling complex protein RSC6